MTLALFRRLTRRRPSLAHWRVVVYTREGCSCCDKAIRTLRSYGSRHGFAIETIDVDTRPELKALFDTTVPAVEINGKLRFKGVVNPVLLDRLIAAETQTSTR